MNIESSVGSSPTGSLRLALLGAPQASCAPWRREGEAWGPGAGGAAGLGKEVVHRAGGMEVLLEPAAVRVCVWKGETGVTGRLWREA